MLLGWYPILFIIDSDPKLSVPVRVSLQQVPEDRSASRYSLLRDNAGSFRAVAR